MEALQVWLVRALAHDTPVSAFMRTAWGWPVAESLHFVGLGLLFGCVGGFDLRLLGIGRRIPIAAMHQLIRWGLAGWAVTAATGAMFLMTEPDQYIYNPSFQLKLLLMGLAGVNAVTFYATQYRHTLGSAARTDAPRSAKLIAAVSLSLWMAIVVGGRMITFFRPGVCGADGPGFIATCIPD